MKKRKSKWVEAQQLADLAAAFIKKLVDWPDVIVDIFWDEHGGVRVNRIWSSKSQWPELGWRRSDRDPKPLAIILLVEEFIRWSGCLAVRRRLKQLIQLEVDD